MIKLIKATSEHPTILKNMHNYMVAVCLGRLTDALQVTNTD